MNTHLVIHLDKDELIYPTLNDDEANTLLNYLKAIKCLQITRDKFSIYNLAYAQLQLAYEIHYDSTIKRKKQKPKVDWNDEDYFNALIMNFFSSAVILEDSIEKAIWAVFDSESKRKEFYNKYRKKFRDECFFFGLGDFLRNYSQHGDLPVSFPFMDSFACFDLDRIIRVEYFTLDETIEAESKRLIEMSTKFGIPPHVSVVDILSEHTERVSFMYYEYYRFIKQHLFALRGKVDSIVRSHPDIVMHSSDCFNNLAVFKDCSGIGRAFDPNDDTTQLFDECSKTAELFHRDMANEHQKLIKSPLRVPISR